MMKDDLHKVLEPLRKMSGSEACYELGRHWQKERAFADVVAVALADGKLTRFDEPIGKRFCTQDLYGWLNSCAKYGRMTEARVFVQGLDHSKKRVRRFCVSGLIHFPKVARAAARRRLDASSAGTREAAVRVLEGIRDKKSQGDLQSMLASEKSKTVIKALEETLAGFGALTKSQRVSPKAKAPRFKSVQVSADPSIAQNIRAFFNDRSCVLVATEQLAAALGITPEQAEAEMLSLRATEEKDAKRPKKWIRAHQVGWILWWSTDPWSQVKAPLPKEIDAYVAAAAYSDLDRLLAAAGRKAPKALGTGGPALKYRDGRKMSAGARAWFIAELFGCGAVLLRAALDDESCGELAMWLVDKELPHRNTMSLIANEAFTNDAADRYVRRRLKRKQLDRWAGAERVAFDRWCLRMWRTISHWNSRMGGLIACPERGAWPIGQSVERLEEHFPHGDDPSGSAAQWMRWISECLEQAMAGEREWSLEDFRRRYMENPLARKAADGIVFEFGVRDADVFQIKGSVVLAGDGFESQDGAVTLPGVSILRVAHPSRGTEGWPNTSGPFPQRERGPVSDSLEVSDRPVDGKVWARRLLRQWMLNGTPEHADHFRLLRYDLKYYGTTMVEFHHSGYYRDEPVKLLSVTLDGLVPLWTRDKGCHQETWMRLSPALRCEIARDVRAMHAPVDQPTEHVVPSARSSAKDTTAVAGTTAVATSTGLPAPVIELAKSSRSKCRGCRNKIEKGDWRLGDPYLVSGSSSGRTAMGWWHLACALKTNKASLTSALELADEFSERDVWRAKL